MNPHLPTATDRWLGRLATTVTVLALLAIVLLVATACKLPEPPPPPTGRIVHTRVEPAADGGVRVVATVQGPDGGTWNVRLPGTTACSVGDRFPDCAN